MDGGKSAFLLDPTAVVNSPANLTELREPGVLGSLTAVYGASEYKPFMGSRVETEDSWKWLPAAAAVFPLDPGLLTAGVSVSVPYGQSTRWPKDAPFAPVSPYYARLQVVDVQPVLAYRLAPTVSVAVGADLYFSEVKLHQSLPYRMMGLPASGAGAARLEGDDNAFGGVAAVSWTPGERHRLAMVYRSPFSLEQQGDIRISGLPPQMSGQLPARSSFKMEMDMPAVVSLGYGLELNDDLRLGADIEWIEFSRNETMPLHLESPVLRNMFPSEFRQEWKDAWTVGLAAEWDWTPRWTLRAGYKFMESPVRSEYFSPILPDADKHNLSLGLGYRCGPHSVAAAYIYSIYDDAEISGNHNPLVDGTYEMESHIVALHYSLDF